MEITRKRVRTEGVTTFVDPRTDLLLDKKNAIYLHYLPAGDGGTKHRNSIKYQFVKYQLGSYVRVIGFYDYEIAAKRYAEEVVKRGGNLRVIERTFYRSAKRVPSRGKEILEKVLREVVAENRIQVKEEKTIPHLEYSNEFFDYLRRERALWDVPFRTIEGFVKDMSTLTGEFNPLTYLPVFEKIKDAAEAGLTESITRNSRNNVFAVIDSRGFRITDEREWLESNLSGNRKKWVRMHVVIDPETMNINVVR